MCCVFDCRLGVCGDKSSSVVITAAVLAMAIIINYIGLMIIKETMLGERERQDNFRYCGGKEKKKTRW